MGFFGKKKEDVQDYNAETTLKTELEEEVEKLQKKFREKQTELEKITQRNTTVKEEYDSTVGSLMIVKKELNQKKIELDIIQREYRETREKAKKAELIKDSKSVERFNKTEGDHSKIKEELDEFTKKHNEIKEQLEKEQATLHNIKKQQVEVEKELEEANSRLYNAKNELDEKEIFEDASILTTSEKEFIGVDNESQKSSAKIIEAASAVVGSLKSKLNTTVKELETVQTLLEKEKAEHEKTKKDLDNLKQTTQSLDKS